MECGSSKMNTCNFSPAPQPKTDQDEGGTRIPLSKPHLAGTLTLAGWETKESRRERSGVVRALVLLGPGQWSGPGEPHGQRREERDARCEIACELVWWLWLSSTLDSSEFALRVLDSDSLYSHRVEREIAQSSAHLAMQAHART